MCEEMPAVVYCVGYVLPVSCCVAGACMSCYGCYRYYRAGEIRRRRMERIQRNFAGFPEVFPRIKRDTLKKNMIKAFTKSSKKEKILPQLDLNEEVLKDMRDACPICIDTYDAEPKTIFVGLINKCGHYFHFECLWSWLELNQTCPICRVNCDLSEKDLTGLSLEQVLNLFIDQSVKHQNIKTQDTNLNLHGSRSQPSILNRTANDDDDDSVCIHNTGNTLSRSVTVATVITTQPKTVPAKTTGLIERMMQRFEGGHDDGDDFGVSGAAAGVFGVSVDVSGADSNVNKVDLEGQGHANPTFE